MTGITRFVNAGLTDAEQRIGRRLPPAVVDDPWVTRVVESSVLARTLARLMRIGRAALASSRAAGIARVIALSWRRAAWPARRRAVGLCLLAAVITHLLLVGMLNSPVGWLWLILPGMTATVGLILVLASAAPGARSR